jgi:hypothetical protein
MPIAVWDLLPCNPAYSFVGFVRSENILLSPLTTKGALPGPESKTPRASADTAILTSPLPTSGEALSAAGVHHVIANDADVNFAALLRSRNVSLQKSADSFGRSFCGCPPTDPLELSAAPERIWEADLSRSRYDISRVLFRHIIRRLPLTDRLGWIRLSQWRCEPVPSKYTAFIDQLSLPRPSFVLAFASTALLSDSRFTDLANVARILCPQGLPEDNQFLALPFYSIEPYDGSRDDVLKDNLNTASQALHNVYLLMKMAGHESLFFEKVRFYSTVCSHEGFKMRVHRAIQLDQGRIQPDCPLGFRFDVVHKKNGTYTKTEIHSLIKKVYSYGVEILLPILKSAMQKILEQQKEGHLPTSV